MWHILLLLLLLFSPALLAKSTTLSLELNHVNVRSALQWLAQMGHINLVLTDEVQGEVTLYLKNVSWHEAFYIILKTKGFSERHIGNTIWVAKTIEIMNQEKQCWQAAQQAEELAPFIMRSISIHYAKASDILAILNQKGSLLSPQGHVLADDRAHLIWLKDTPTHVKMVEHVIHRLDVRLQQVMIEARIVNVDRSFEKNLGLHFSFSKSGVVKETSHSEEEDNGALSFSTNKANATPAGMFVAKLSQGMLLDVQLAALMNEGKGEFISHPKLLTQDQKTASIEAGEEIPFQEKTRGGGSTVVFKKAVLSLEVTPRILPRNQLLLDLKVNQDAPGIRVNDTLMIDTRQIETHVQVKSGQTLVLGGILEENKWGQKEGIPFLSEIPLLGRLFECHDKSTDHRELLVFITPTIVEEEG